MDNALLVPIRAHRKAGRFAEALEALAPLLKGDAPPLPALLERALILGEMQRPEAAQSCLEGVLRRDPDHAEAHFLLGNLFTAMERHEQAVPCFETLLRLRPDHLDGLNNLGAALFAMGRAEEAIPPFRRLTALAPDAPPVHDALGLALFESGQVREAAACFQRAIALKPDFVQALRHLSLARNHAHEDEPVRAMAALLERPGLTDEERIQLNFAHGKALEDLGRHRQAWKRYQEGNRLARAGLNYDPDKERLFFERVMRVFDRPFLQARRDWGDPHFRPILILGLPRSGSTLIEQILASHSRVFAAGESERLTNAITGLTRLPSLNALPLAAPRWPRERFQQIAAAYANAFQQADGALPACVVDKTLNHFRILGLIHILLPGARIIHCQRDPRDICWSNFKTLFASAQNFAYDLEEMADYHHLYRRLMNHWEETLPGEIFSVRYERLTENPTEEIQRLLAFCGLPWEEECLDFHRNRRVVRTASLAQVRQPLYRTAVGRWRHYPEARALLEKALGPLETPYGEPNTGS